jgi:hypothetical protein
MALLCACCHRLLQRLVTTTGEWSSVKKLNKSLSPVQSYDSVRTISIVSEWAARMFVAQQEIRMSAEMRKVWVERAREKLAAQGLKLDPDPRYRVMEERWVIGEITMAEFRSEYLDLVRQKEEDSWLKRTFDRSTRKPHL